MGITRFFEHLGEGADFYRRRSQENRSFVRWMFEASNLMDGRRSLGEIQDRLAAEFGEVNACWDDLCRLVDDLAAAKMVSF
jgi:hypothetical protein